MSCTKPFKPVSKDTVSRWIKSTLEASGVDTDIFRPYGVRAASTSAAMKSGLSLAEVMKAAGWLSATTFATYYHKTVIVTSQTFGESVIAATSE